MIESGSHTPGVSAEDFLLPHGTALRMELPAPALRPFVTHYFILDSDRSLHDGRISWALPTWATMRFIMTDAPMTLRLGNRVYDPIPHAALYGFTSRARQITSQGGVTIGAGISPLGWARMLQVSAEKLRDQVVPLADVMPRAPVEGLRRALKASDQAADVAPILDAFFAPLLREPSRAEPAIAALMRIITDEEVYDIGTASERTGLSSTSLRRLAVRYFGFPPKTLLVQERFMRSLRRMLLADETPDYSVIASTYFDKSHFLRDADRFLGMTPRRFMQRDNRYMLAIMRAHDIVTRAAQDAAPVAPPGNHPFTPLP